MKILALLLSLFLSTNNNKSPGALEDGKVDFVYFLSQFEKVDLPSSFDTYRLEELSLNYHANVNANQNRLFAALNRDYLQKGISKFSRGGTPIVQPLYRFYPDANTIATVFVTGRNYAMENIDVKLTLFDLKGNILDQSRLIASINVNETKTCSFVSAQECIINNYKNVWMEPIGKVKITENEILNYELLGEESIYLTQRA